MIPRCPPAVLVVDDDPDHAQIARMVLRSIAPDVPVDLRSDTRSMLDALRNLPHGSLVLVDRVIEGAESFDAVAAMRAQRPDIVIVMLSAALSSVDRAYAIACGAAEAIEKPSDLEGWRTMLGALVTASDAVSPRPSPRPPTRIAPRAA